MCSFTDEFIFVLDGPTLTVALLLSSFNFNLILFMVLNIIYTPSYVLILGCGTSGNYLQLDPTFNSFSPDEMTLFWDVAPCSRVVR